MRQVLLNGKYYKIQGDIIKRAVSPWMAKVSAGSREYSDFSQAQLEEWHDFRNGIGLESMLPAESARTWFTEGIDFTTPRSAVLGPLVNTAEYDTWEGTHDYSVLNFVIPTAEKLTGFCYECTTDGGSSGGSEPTWPEEVDATVGDGDITWTCRAYLSPIKIIDFKGTDSTAKTYIIQNSRILKWDGTNLDCVDNTFADPLDAIVVTDDTDEYLIVSSATAAIKTTDGATWTTLLGWKTPNSTNDPGDSWTDDANAIDDDITSYASTLSLGSSNALEFHLTNPMDLDRVRVYASDDGTPTNPDVNIGLYYEGAWHTIFTGSITKSTWTTKTNSAGVKHVSKARVYANSFTGNQLFIYEFEFGWIPMGYLANYANRLYCIGTTGQYISYSATKDIDDYGGNFNLTGDYGTAYDLFEGKLLADGTPVLYFCGTKGLYTIDTTNLLAYRQEVEYPPLTYSGHRGMYWNASVWVATGFGILKVTPSMATFVGPDQDDGLPSTYQGSIFDMVTVNNWLVYCVNKTLSTDKSSILKRNSSYGGNLQVYTSAADTAIACLHHTASSTTYPNGRLWFGEGTNVKYMMFPDTSSNVKQISTYQYVDDSGYGKLPIFRKLAVIPKVALGVGAITKSCVDADNEYIEVFYGLNGAAPTTSLGTFLTSPHPTILTFPPPVGEAESTGLGTQFYTIQFAIKLYRKTASTTKSPELESLLFYYLPRPVTISAWTFIVECTDEDAEARIAEFEAIKALNTLVVFNPTGDELKTDFDYNVALTTMPMRFYVENQGARETKGVQITVEEIFNG